MPERQGEERAWKAPDKDIQKRNPRAPKAGADIGQGWATSSAVKTKEGRAEGPVLCMAARGALWQASRGLGGPGLPGPVLSAATPWRVRPCRRPQGPALSLQLPVTSRRCPNDDASSKPRLQRPPNPSPLSVLTRPAGTGHAGSRRRGDPMQGTQRHRHCGPEGTQPSPAAPPPSPPTAAHLQNLVLTEPLRSGFL